MRTQRRSMSQINVVPYIDVMLVLLVIFMVTAPMIQVGSIELPSIGRAQAVPAKPIEITVKANRNLLFKNHDTGGSERAVTSSELSRLIREAQISKPEQPVLIAGDKDVAYAAVIEVMNELQRQQVKRVGLLVQPEAR